MRKRKTLLGALGMAGKVAGMASGLAGGGGAGLIGGLGNLIPGSKSNSS